METCPRCHTKCVYPHGSDQEEFMSPLMPEGMTFHRCMFGHDWLSDQNGVYAEGLEGVAKEKPTRKIRNEYITDEPIPRAVTLKDEDVAGE